MRRTKEKISTCRGALRLAACSNPAGGGGASSVAVTGITGVPLKETAGTAAITNGVNVGTDYTGDFAITIAAAPQ
jgi:hypothetical protein